MDIGTYSSASGGILQELRLEITNNNLANLNTPGFKRQLLVSREAEFADTLTSKMQIMDPFMKGDQERNPGVLPVRSFTDFSLGAIKDTGNPLDVALKNPSHFFVVNTPNGDRYTRAGNFTLNAAGQIVTGNGRAVLGDGGPIETTGGIPSIAGNGNVMINGINAGRLRVVTFDDLQVLRPIGENLFQIDGKATANNVDDASVVSGALEMSNVSAIQGMLDLIKANRGFEVYQKSAKTIDEMNQQATSQLGNFRS